MNSDHPWQYFQWLFTQGLEIAYVPTYGLVILILAVGLVVSFLCQRPFGNGKWKRYYALVLSQVLFYPAIVAVGVFYQDRNYPALPQPKVAATGFWIINILFYLSLSLSIFWIYRMKGLRWFAFCFVALLQLFLCGAELLASMSISGTWL